MRGTPIVPAQSTASSVRASPHLEQASRGLSSVALLASHPGRSLSPTDVWLRLAWNEALAWARAGVRVEGSLGTPGYDLTALAVLQAGGMLHLSLLPSSLTRAQSLQAEPLAAQPQVQVLRDRTTPAERDLAVLTRAELAVGVAIRRGGQLERLLLERFRRGQPVAVCVPPTGQLSSAAGASTAGRARGGGASEGPRHFDGSWRLLDAGLPPWLTGPEASWPLPQPRAASSPPDLLEGFAVPPGCPYELWARAPLEGDTLVHTTRPASGPWPEQSRWAWLHQLAQGCPEADRRVGAVLRHILQEGRLRGGGRLIPGGVPMVCLSARPLSALLKPVYRVPLARWDGLPFGLVFRREALERLGARPVRYLSPAIIEELSHDERLFVQKHQPPEIDWSQEEEWRLPGDLLLGALDPGDVRILLPSGAQIPELLFRDQERMVP